MFCSECLLKREHWPKQRSERIHCCQLKLWWTCMGCIRDVTPWSGNQAAMVLEVSFGGELWIKKQKIKGRFYLDISTPSLIESSTFKMMTTSSQMMMSWLEKQHSNMAAYYTFWGVKFWYKLFNLPPTQEKNIKWKACLKRSVMNYQIKVLRYFLVSLV